MDGRIENHIQVKTQSTSNILFPYFVEFHFGTVTLSFLSRVYVKSDIMKSGFTIASESPIMMMSPRLATMPTLYIRCLW